MQEKNNFSYFFALLTFKWTVSELLLRNVHCKKYSWKIFHVPKGNPWNLSLVSMEIFPSIKGNFLWKLFHVWKGIFP